MSDFREYISELKKNGSSISFQNLVQLFEQRVFTLCYRIIGNREEAEEAAQDSFLNCYRNIHKLEDESKFPQWLLKIAYTKSIDYTRKKKLELVDFDELSDFSGDVNSKRSGTLEHSLLLEKSLQQLSPQSRAIITLYYQEDMPIKEIASLLAISQSNVKIKLHRSRIEIKEILDKQLLVAPNK